MQATGRIPVSINGSIASGVRNVSFTKTTPQKTHKFADKSRARSEGQPEYKFSITCSCLEGKQVILEQIADAQAVGEVNISYQVGSNEYMFIDCGLDSEAVSSDQDGTADLALSGTATDFLTLR